MASRVGRVSSGLIALMTDESWRKVSGLELPACRVTALGVAHAVTARIEMLKFSGNPVQIKFVAGGPMFYQRAGGGERNVFVGERRRHGSKTLFADDAVKSRIAI